MVKGGRWSQKSWVREGLEVRVLSGVIRPHQKAYVNRLMRSWVEVIEELRSWAPDVTQAGHNLGWTLGITGLGLEAVEFGVWSQRLRVIEAGAK